ncbi:hypothetical protein [Stutzerimonas nitrititolerans]|uniref:hypothetical protein n=1 Tax=Stutzerimonas nitrititolerans TaxID=2482751 RepID=UPI0028A90BB3|nr:hypothetical protein [Stutzerimonas nitrititolerans]
MEPLPYEERFWRSDTLAAVKSFAPPVGEQGFVCALFTNWTRGEKNDSGINLSILAQLLEQPDHTLADAGGNYKDEGRRT